MSPRTVYFFHIPCTHFVKILLQHVSYLVVRQVFYLDVAAELICQKIDGLICHGQPN